MSRIHEALRRGRSPASPSPDGRTANADAVLAALGYRSDRPRRVNPGILLGTIVCVLAAGVIWWMLPSSVLPQSAPQLAARQQSASQHAAPKQAVPQQAVPPQAAPKQAAITTSPAPHDGTPVESKPGTETKPPTLESERMNPSPGPAATAQPHSATKPMTVARAEAAVPRQMARVTANEPVPSKLPAPAEPESAPKTDDFRLAVYYQRAGDFEQALVHYKAVLQRDEMNADAHNNLGNLYMTKALFDDAAREFRRVVAIEPRYVTAHVNLSAALYQLKRYDESAAEARTALHFDARSDDAYVNLALAQAAAGQPADARASLTRALEIDRHNAAAHYNLALQYEKAGEIALALDHYRAFLQYAGPEQAGYAVDVRSRVRALESRREPGTPNREPRSEL